MPNSRASGAPLSLLRVSPISLSLEDPGSFLAIKGMLRRFAPWTVPGRSEGMAVYEGKGI